MTSPAPPDALHHDEWVTVTRSAILINGTAYAPASIASVRVAELRGHPLIDLVGWFLVLVGVQAAACSACVDAAKGTHENVIKCTLCIVGGLAIVVLGPRLTRTRHTVFLGIGGKDVAVVHSPDPAWALKVSAAIGAVMGQAAR